jgi:hypothetical protein
MGAKTFVNFSPLDAGTLSQHFAILSRYSDGLKAKVVARAA